MPTKTKPANGHKAPAPLSDLVLLRQMGVKTELFTTSDITSRYYSYTNRSQNIRRLILWVIIITYNFFARIYIFTNFVELHTCRFIFPLG